MINGTLERAILETLLYSDIFEYPLHMEEIHRYLPIDAEMEEVSLALSVSSQVGKKEDFYFLAGHEKFVEIRKQRAAHSQRLLPHALRYGRMLGHLPFIRLVALTGSLAVMNSSGNADFDYMLVAARGRVWTARAFALLLNRITRRFGHTLCPNLIISENALAWSTRDLYTAHELCQMIPVSGMDAYRKLMKANVWVKDFLPNAFLESKSKLLKNTQERTSVLQRIFELPLRGKLGDDLENWEMKRKIARFSKQAGFGEETIFNAEICQGNFEHHSKRTKQMFEEKMSAFIREEGLEVQEP
jgi:hypothetical protein